MRQALGVAAALTGAAASMPCAYLATLSLAALRRLPGSDPSETPDLRLVVLVPAHDEAELIGRCLESLQDQTYPRGLYRIVVIADNCTDDTAGIAASKGAEVMDRRSRTGRGKGYALRWAMDRILGSTEPFDAFVVVDADSVADRGLLSGLAAARGSGADAVQGEYLALDEESGARARLRSAAFLLFHRVRFAGRATLGLPCFLVGNGMLFSRHLIETYPWNAFSRAEDLEYSVDLRLRGVRPVFAERARLWAPVSSSGAGARTQRLRWEGGRSEIVRSRLPRLLRSCLQERRWDLWDAAADLAVPPLGVLTVLVVGGGATGLLFRALGVLDSKYLGPWLAASIALPVHVLVGLRAADAPAETYRALLRAPALVASELLTRVSLLRPGRATTWERTARRNELTDG